jgi:hypothetical protein
MVHSEHALSLQRAHQRDTRDEDLCLLKIERDDSVLIEHRLCAGSRQCGSFVEVCAVGCVLSLGMMMPFNCSCRNKK